MLKPVISYSIEKSKFENDWILWKESSTEHGMCSRNIFRGKRSECIEEKKKRIKETK